MVNIKAAQHFFTSVPAEQSPKNRRGYQTLFHTRGLSDKIIWAIEDRAQYATGSDNPVKRQFYNLPDGLLAISQTVALTERDEFGRKGRYLTHTFILDSDAFHQLGSCPIDVFRQAQFETTLNPVFRQGGLETGHVPVTILNVTVQWFDLARQSIRDWSLDKIIKLGRLAWQAVRLHERKEPVALTGTEKEQMTTLELLFLLSPPRQRMHLSFDTYASGCNWSPSVFFHILGYPDRSKTRTISHWIDAHGKHVKSSLSPDDDGPFGTWISQALSRGESGAHNFHKRQIWADYLSEVVREDQMVMDLRSLQIPSSFMQSFAQSNIRDITSRWLSYLPSSLSPRLLRPFRDDVVAHPGQYLKFLSEGVNLQQIDNFMLDLLMSLKRPPERSDQRALKSWIKSRSNPLLDSFLVLWTKNKRAWRRTLSSLSQEDYVWLIDGLKSWPTVPISLDFALVEPHGADWIRKVGPSLPPGDWRKTLPDLSRMNEDFMPVLAEIVPFLSSPVKQEIARWLKRSNVSAPRLRAALSVLKEEKRFFGLF
jgi:hypothetical protein